MDLNWVDWDNDRHQDGWLAYMNLGVDSPQPVPRS